MKRIGNLLKPTIDYVFKRVFGCEGSEKITAELLTAILNEKVENVNLDKNTILEKDISSDKIGILDVKAKFNGDVTCDIEMQVVEQTNIYKRLLFYWSKLYIQNIKSGEDYNKLKKCIVILIADFELDNLSDIKKYITKWEIKERNFGKHVLTDLFEIVIIELPKIAKHKENSTLDIWVKFIKNPEVITMCEEEENETIREAKKILEDISQDDYVRHIAELRQKYIMDQKAIQEFGFEKGIKQGLERGRQEGREEGRQEGEKETLEQTAKKMLEKGFKIETIIEITNLTRERIEELKKQ